MMKTRPMFVGALLAVCLFQQSVSGQGGGASPVLRALEEEAKRAMDVLGRPGESAAYFVGYEVSDLNNVDIEASLGALRSSSTDRARLLDIDVRVGEYQLDNTHQIRGARGAQSAPNFSVPVLMPLDDDLDSLKSVIWLETDRRYKAAADRFIQVKANMAIKVDEEDTSADFSRETPQTVTLPLPSLNVNTPEWENKLKMYSAVFSQHPEIYDGALGLSATATHQYVVNSEGTSIQHGTARIRLSISARTKAEDGMDLYRFESFDAHTPANLPNDAVIRQTIDQMIVDLKALRDAPMIEPFAGPAILSGRASGVFFHEIFGHRIEGQRQKSEDEGQTFTKRVDQLILPDFISVFDDPTTKVLAGADLNGHYAFDNDGVPAQRVTVVDKGILKNFLLSRSPIAGFERSNGHGRKAPGYRTVGRQANLIIEASSSVSDAKLREMLIEEARTQNKPFGLIFKDISGGFTMTGRASTQAFQVTPIMVYRVYVDGRPDELVRGVDLIGTPLTSFSRIVAAGDKQEVFNGFCGAESGFIPVAAVSPSILTTQIEVQKRSKSSERLPILPPPVRGGGL
jgi:predicted Zn-dependent protease